jgi:hypothetical protein
MDFDMHFGDQGAGRVEYLETAFLSFRLDGLGDSVGAENDRGVFRHFRKFLNEDGSTVSQAVDHVAVMNHFVSYVNWGSEYLDGAVDDLDGAVDASAKTTGIGEDDFHGHMDDF